MHCFLQEFPTLRVDWSTAQRDRLISESFAAHGGIDVLTGLTERQILVHDGIQLDHLLEVQVVRYAAHKAGMSLSAVDDFEPVYLGVQMQAELLSPTSSGLNGGPKGHAISNALEILKSGGRVPDFAGALSEQIQRTTSEGVLGILRSGAVSTERAARNLSERMHTAMSDGARRTTTSIGRKLDSLDASSLRDVRLVGTLEDTLRRLDLVS
jgi:hypothetical protein